MGRTGALGLEIATCDSGHCTSLLVIEICLTEALQKKSLSSLAPPPLWHPFPHLPPNCLCTPSIHLCSSARIMLLAHLANFCLVFKTCPPFLSSSSRNPLPQVFPTSLSLILFLKHGLTLQSWLCVDHTGLKLTENLPLPPKC